MKKYKVNLIGTTKLNFSTSLSHARGNAQVSYQSLFLLHSKYYQFCTLYLEGS